jgi:streptogramin lyase
MTVRDGLLTFIGGLAAVLSPSTPVGAAPMPPPPRGELAGKVTVPKPVGQLTVYALNTDKDVGYMVYVVNGRYRFTHLFPGHYEVSLRGTPGQMNWSLAPQTSKIDIAANKSEALDIALIDPTIKPTYVGGLSYEGWSDRPEDGPQPIAQIEPYDVIYPAGPARETMERICFGCHTVQLYPYNVARTYADGRPPHDKDGWAITVERMAHGSTFNIPGKASNFDGDKLLSPHDRDVLVEYLAYNFGPNSIPRVVQQESDPTLDPQALDKAEFVEYRFFNTPEFPKRASHTIAFNPDGTVYALDRGSRGSVMWVNPVTGEKKDYPDHGIDESSTADRDGTLWYGGLRHYDPKTNLMDEYRLLTPNGNSRPIDVSTSIFDSNGDLWMSLRGVLAGGLGKWERKTNTFVWWDVPILRSRPYGITLDHNDKVWFAEYHNSGVASFDPKTQQFKHYRLTSQEPTNIRRPGADSKNMIWASTWGSKGMQNAALYKLNPETGAVKEYKLGIPYANPYDSDPDDNDNVWVGTDNHILKFDQKTEKWTRYPVPTRTDVPRLSITGEGTVWFADRNAGQSNGYGATVSALYPDKDHIKTFAATYSEKSNHSRLVYRYKGPDMKVTGKVVFVPMTPQNPDGYAQMLRELGMPVPTVNAWTAVGKGKGGTASDY